MSRLLPFMFLHPPILQSGPFHPGHYAHRLQRHSTGCSDGHQHQAPAGSSGQGTGSCVWTSSWTFADVLSVRQSVLDVLR